MESLLASIVKGYLRYMLFGVGVWLSSRGIASDAQFEQLLTGLSIVVSTLLWVAWVKLQDRIKLTTALALEPQSLNELDATLKSGWQAPALTSPHVTPSIHLKL